MDETTQLPQNPPKKSMIGWILILIIIIAAIIYAVAKSGGSTNSETATSTPQEATTGQEASSTTSASVQTIAVEAKNFSFTPSEIHVKQGDKVQIKLTSSGGTHDWVIDEFNARSPRIGSGQSATIEFVADKKGTFEYYCSVGEHRQMGMRGNLIVE